jgi:hypothetical protein
MRVRRLGWLLASIPSVALLACSGSTDTPIEVQPLLDGSLGPTDAGLTADTTMPDASSVDAAEEPPPPLPVTVIVLGPSGPEAGKTIVFSDATGAIVTTGTTDASGTVVQRLGTASQVTALLGTTDVPQLLTVVGVQPGDTLTAPDGAAVAVANQVGSDVLVTMHGSPPANTENYLVRSGYCNAPPSSGPSVDLDVSGCTNRAGQFPLLAVALDDGGAPLAYSFEKPNALGTDGGPTSIVMTGAWNPMGTETVSANGLSASDIPYLSYSQVAAGVSYGQTDYVPTAGDSGVSSTSFASHPLYPDFVQTELSVTQFSTQQYIGTVTAIATRTATPSGSASFDAAGLLPVITSAGVDTTDPMRPTVAWTSTAPLTGAAGTIAEMIWYYEATEQGGSWTVVVPSSVTSAQMPVLPGAASNLVPGTNALLMAPTVIAIGRGDLVDYAAFRRAAGQLLTEVPYGYYTSPAIGPLPSDGTMKMTMTYQLGGG